MVSFMASTTRGSDILFTLVRNILETSNQFHALKWKYFLTNRHPLPGGVLGLSASRVEVLEDCAFHTSINKIENTSKVTLAHILYEKIVRPLRFP